MRRSLFPRLLLLTAAFSFAACDSGGDDGPSDSTPPALVSATTTGATVALTFSEAIDPASVSPGAFALSPSGAVASASGSGATATLVLAAPLDASQQQTYTVVASGIRDAAGNAAGALTASFTYGSGGGGGGGGGNTGGTAIGAAYPNAGDNRLVLISADGTRWLTYNPANSSFTAAQNISTLESGNIPIAAVGGAATLVAEEETYFFNRANDQFTNYERETADFDAPASFDVEYDELGYELNGIGAACEGRGVTGNDPDGALLLFNTTGTRYQLWRPEIDVFGDEFNFPSQFGPGTSPFSSVGACVYHAPTGQLYLFNQAGTMYTLYSNGTFSSAFPVTDLGSYSF